jgi:hypothetical protein
LVNIVGLASPLVVLAGILPLGLLGGHYYKELLVDYEAIQQSLGQQARAWTPGAGFNVASLVPVLPDLESLVQNVDKLGVYARGTYIFFSAITFVLGVALASIGGFFIVTLRRVLIRSNAMFINDKTNDDGHKRVKRSLNVSCFLSSPSSRRSISDSFVTLFAPCCQ